MIDLAIILLISFLSQLGRDVFLWVLFLMILERCYGFSLCDLQEARALLGRYEYQKGNVEAALHVFEGIDISAVAPKIKSTLARREDRRRKSSQNFATPPLSIHAVTLLLEAIFLKSKSLQALGRFKGTFCPLLIMF